MPSKVRFVAASIAQVVWLLLLLLICLVIRTRSSATSAASSTSDDYVMLSSTAKQQKLVIGVDGGTESIRACCFDAITGRVVGKASAVSYPTHHPHPAWAEQDPETWYTSLGQAVRGAVASLLQDNNNNAEICAMALATTCCSVVALDSDHQPLRPCLLWMDQRSAPQTATIMEKCRGDPALAVNCGGDGPLSAEWMTPKALWIYENEPDIWRKATTICEYQDFLNYRLTGNMVASSCNAACRWHWDGESCIQEGGPVVAQEEFYPGRPLSLYDKLGIPELADKLPAQCIPMGTKVGGLTQEAAKHLDLPKGLPVIQGGPDAFVGMIGLGCISAGQLCLITGSSHLHCVVSSKPLTAPGVWGAYRGAPLPGLNFAEGGQSSTGSLLRWAKTLFGGTNDDAGLNYKVLDMEADGIAPGADGLIALETFQGSRTPVTDPLARGALMGLTLSHTRGHVWRALMEAVCFGTRACIDALAKAGHGCDEIILAGGVARSNVWLQMHADVTGKTVTVCENSDAPSLGSAILASVGVGIHKSVPDAVESMVRTSKRIEPDPIAAKKYDKIYKEIYCKVGDCARPIAHAIHNVRGGASEFDDRRPEDPVRRTKPLVSPSLLACDWANIQGEVIRCRKAGLNRFHIDVFDGVFLDSPSALTFGPQMVEAIRRSCDDFSDSTNGALLDVHVCVDRPARFVDAMAEAGADLFIFQWEAMEESVAKAKRLGIQIVEAGMKCGVSINPGTNVDVLYPLLETNLVDAVNVLAVEPGFGGQRFQSSALGKIRQLKKWRDEGRVSFDIMVDGGVNAVTALDVIASGADVLVAGSFLFNHPDGLATGALALTEREKGALGDYEIK